MTEFCESLPETIYLLNPAITSQQLMNAIHRSLLKSEALAMVASLMDFDLFSKETIDNYLWALSDTIKEARILYERGKDCC